MTRSRNVGRGVGALLVLQLAGGLILPYVLLARVLTSPGFLENAAQDAVRLRAAVFLFLFSAAVTLGISIAAYPVLRLHTRGLALCLLALAVANAPLQNLVGRVADRERLQRSAASPMTHHLDASGARRLARIGGILYLVIIAIGAFGELVVRGRVFVPGDVAQTASNLRSMEWLWRLGIAGEIVLLASALALALIFYILLRPVSRHLAAMAVLFNLIAIAIEGAATVALAAALLPVATDGTVMMLIRSHSLGFGIGLIFFGVECVILGALIARSSYIPKWIGTLMLFAGGCYVINSFALILSPPLSSRLFPAILLPALVAELSLAVWLLVKGVKDDQWDDALALSCSQPP